MLLAMCCACTQADCPRKSPVTHSISVNGQDLVVEIAATPSARACGLSLRDTLPANRGMLFVYQDDGVREFWMKDTHVPLDIAYLDAEGLILEIRQMHPRDAEHRYRSSGPARYALETQLDWFQSHGVGVGDTIDLRLPDG